MPDIYRVGPVVVLLLAISSSLWTQEIAPPAAPVEESYLGSSLFAPAASTPTEEVPATIVLPERWMPGENLIIGWRWENGLRYELGHKELQQFRQQLQPAQQVSPLRGKFGLKLQLDAAAYQADDALPDLPGDSGVRLLRLYTSGSFFLLRPATYKIEMEFDQQNNTRFFNEAYLEFSGIPLLQRVRGGFFRAPMGLEGYAGSSDTTFMSVAAPTEAFQPGIRYGAQVAGCRTDQRATWAGGLFANADDPDLVKASTNPSSLIGRVTALPFLAETKDAPCLLHLGVGLQYLFTDQEALRYRARPESFYAPRLVDTRTLAASEALHVAGEAAYAHGPWSVQGELFAAEVPDAAADNLRFWGAYLQGNWVLTGENRPYDRKLGVFRKIVPAKPFSRCNGHWGAWELAARLSCLDLSDGTLRGGRQTMATFGLNLYLTANARIMVNVGQGRVSDCARTGDVKTLQTRLQIDY